MATKILDSGLIFTSIITYPRGGFPVAARLSHLLNIENLSVVGGKTPLMENCLVVDDISDTGKTLNHAKTLGYIHFATLHWHRQSIVKPTWYIWEKKDDWIVYPWEL